MSFDTTPPPPAPPLPPFPPEASRPDAQAHASDKSFIATWLLSWLLGLFGADRFYLGKIGTGVAKLLTFGGIGVWYLVDLIITLTGNATDARGAKVRGSGKEPMIAWIVTGAVVVVGMIGNAIAGGSAPRDSGSAPAIVATAPAAVESETHETSAAVDERPTVPAVTGMTVAQARDALSAAGFVLAPPAGSADDWTVTGQDVAAASRADAGTSVTVTADAPAPTLSLAQKNAIAKAKSYLTLMAFSRSGLIAQLEYEGFSTEDATLAVDQLNPDWNAQAGKKAKSYLEMTSFSRDGLYGQLEYEGFTPEQIEAGLAAVGY